MAAPVQGRRSAVPPRFFEVAAYGRFDANGSAMRCFGLTPDQVRARSAAAGTKATDSMGFAIAYGALSFAAVSLLAYSIYAYRLIQGTAAMYSAIAAIFIVLTGIALNRLVSGSGTASRFALLFAAAFLAYALLWCAFWFGLKGKYHADLWGSAIGLAVMTCMLQRAFGKNGDFLPLFAVLFTFHTLGYYLGDVLHATARGTAGRLLWGLGHGLGFGAGLGYVLWQCQAPIRTLLHMPDGGPESRDQTRD